MEWKLLDALDEQEAMPDFNELEGYTLSQDIILEVWARYRPV